MSRPDKVVWSEGMLLTQQHLQQFGAYIEYYSEFITKNHLPYCYGLSELVIDETALAAGQFIVERCKGLFQGGDKIEIIAEDNLNIAIESACSVYLCLVKKMSVENLPGYDNAGLGSKESVYFSDVEDVYDNQRRSEVAFARPHYFLSIDHSIPSSVHHLKIAEVTYDQVAGFGLSKTFLPSSMNLFCSVAFRLQLNNIERFFQLKRNALMRHCYQIDTVYLFQFNYILTEIGYAKFVKKYHPWFLYQLLHRFVHALRLEAPELYPIQYDHHQLTKTFELVWQQCQVAVDDIIPHQYQLHGFEKTQDGLLLLSDLDQTALAQATLFIKVVSSTQTIDVDQFIQGSKVAAQSDIRHLCDAALPGISFSVCSKLPNEFKNDTEALYFQLNQSGSLWQNCLKEASIAIVLSEAIADCDVMLIMRRENE